MFGSRILLFLFGTTVISGRVLRNEPPHNHKKMHSMEREMIMEPILERFMASAFPMQNEIASPPPTAFMPQFLQQGSNLFYKPHIRLSPMNYIPYPAVTLIEPSIPEMETIVIEEPLDIPEVPEILPEPHEEIKEFKPIVIPPAPELPPLTNIPTVAVVKEPKPEPLPVPEIIEVPLVPEIKPIEIPKAPELGPFVMPEIPTAIVVENIEPCVHEMNVPSVTLPDVLPPVIIPEAPKQPEVQIEVMEYRPMDIPQAPELPPFVMPEFPTVLIDKPVSTPTLPVTKPQEIPEAPILPPFDMPQLPTPTIVEIVPPVNPQVTEEFPCPPEILSPAPVPLPNPEFNIDIRPINIPEAPILKPIVMPQIPKPVLVEVTNNIFQEPEEIKPAAVIETMPPAPELPQFIMPELPIIQDVEYNKVPSQNQHQTFEIPAAPILPPIVIPQLPASAIEIPADLQSMEVYPCPPQDLRPTPVPYKPEITEAQLLGEEPVYMEFKPMDIPEAPVLKPLEMPQIPDSVLVEVSKKECDESRPDDEIVSNDKPHVIFESLPSAPVLPPLAMPPIPMIQKVNLDNVLLPYKQNLPATFPTFYAQNIIIDRVLPNMIISDKNVAEGVELFSVGRKHPIYPKSYFTPALF